MGILIILLFGQILKQYPIFHVEDNTRMHCDKLSEEINQKKYQKWCKKNVDNKQLIKKIQ